MSADTPRHCCWEITWQLLRIGYPPRLGWLRGGIIAWRTAAKPVATILQVTSTISSRA